MYALTQTQKLRTVLSSLLMFWNVHSSHFQCLCLAARMHKDCKDKYFLDVKGAREEGIDPATAFLSVAIC